MGGTDNEHLSHREVKKSVLNWCCYDVKWPSLTFRPFFQATGGVDRHSDDSSKDVGGGGGGISDSHPDTVTDDQDNELSDPPVAATTTTTTTTASSGIKTLSSAYHYQNRFSF